MRRKADWKVTVGVTLVLSLTTASIVRAETLAGPELEFQRVFTKARVALLRFLEEAAKYTECIDPSLQNDLKPAAHSMVVHAELLQNELGKAQPDREKGLSHLSDSNGALAAMNKLTEKCNLKRWGPKVS